MGRDLTKCHPHLQKLAKELVTVCEKQGMSDRNRRVFSDGTGTKPTV